MNPETHWQQVYSTRQPEQLSWHSPHLPTSLQLIQKTGLPPSASIIDIGAGESALVDDLMSLGYRNLYALDIAPEAFAVSKARLQARADLIHWMTGDILSTPLPPNTFDLWHDRAVFHFLTTDDARRQYIDQVRSAVKPGGYIIMATFGPDGPSRCSGLETMRYDASQLHDEFGPSFTLIQSSIEQHETPWGTPQQFLYCFCRMI